MAVGGVEQLDARCHGALAIGGIGGRRIGGVDPGDAAFRVAQPDRQGECPEKGADRRGFAHQGVMARPQLHQFLAHPGDEAQAQHRSPADGAALGLDRPAGLADHVEAERRSRQPQRIHRPLQLRRLLGRQPGAESQDAPRHRQVGDEGDVAGDLRLVAIAAPDDDHMGIKRQQLGVAVEGKAQFVDFTARLAGRCGGLRAGPQEADGGDDAKDHDADIEPEGRPFMGRDCADKVRQHG